jgi:deazaflavin-dependent oxidoreductase (nitroreductase family)
MSETRYLEPGAFTKHGFNRFVRRLARMGVSVAGSRELRIVGRKSGQVRTVVVNLLDQGGHKYLVSPRGHTEWVRNLRAAGGAGELRVGRRVEPFQATELADDAKVPVIRAYLEKWGWEVGQFFEGLDKNASDEEILAVAPGFPAFSLEVSPR